MGMNQIDAAAGAIAISVSAETPSRLTDLIDYLKSLSVIAHLLVLPMCTSKSACPSITEKAMLIGNNR
jgi:hypothetical protein